jgi:TatD DNase family protein
LPRQVDAHCHVDLYPSPAEIVARAEAEGIRTIAVTNAPSVFAHTKALAAGHIYVRAAVGLHPELIDMKGHELPQMLELLSETRYVGEVGLDFVTTDADNQRRQRGALEAILAGCAAAGDKVLTIHSRRAAAEVIAMIGMAFPGTIILHWFSGSLRDLERAVSAGMFFSVNPAMTRSANGRKLIAAMPGDRVFTETDGPFVHVDGRPAAPPDVARVLPILAAIWKSSEAEALSRVNENFLRAVRAF